MREVYVVFTFVNVSKHMDFWLNATLNSRQKILTASMYATLQREITMSCIERLTHAHASRLYSSALSAAVDHKFALFLVSYPNNINRLLEKLTKINVADSCLMTI